MAVFPLISFYLFIYVIGNDPQEIQLDIPLSQSDSSSFVNTVTYFITKNTRCDTNSKHIHSVVQYFKWEGQQLPAVNPYKSTGICRTTKDVQGGWLLEMGTERHALPGNAAKCWQRFCCTALRKSLNLFILKCFRKHWNKKIWPTCHNFCATDQHVSTDFCFFILFLSLCFNPYSCETIICWRIKYSSCDCSITWLRDFCPWILASDATCANSRCFLYMQVCDFVISFPSSLFTTVFPSWQRGRSGQGKRKAWPKNSSKPQSV